MPVPETSWLRSAIHAGWISCTERSERTDTREIDVVALTIQRPSRHGGGGFDMRPDQIFSHQAAELSSKVFPSAGKAGKHAELPVAPERDCKRAAVGAARRLQASLDVRSLSARMTPPEPATTFSDARELLANCRPQLSIEILDPQNQKQLFFNLGSRAPRLYRKASSFCTGARVRALGAGARRQNAITGTSRAEFSAWRRT